MVFHMANITVTIADETYRQARIQAAKRNTSVSALVRDYLASLVDTDDEFTRLENLQAAVTASITEFSATDRMTRDEVHDRALR